MLQETGFIKCKCKNIKSKHVATGYLGFGHGLPFSLDFNQRRSLRSFFEISGIACEKLFVSFSLSSTFSVCLRSWLKKLTRTEPSDKVYDMCHKDTACEKLVFTANILVCGKLAHCTCRQEKQLIQLLVYKNDIICGRWIYIQTSVVEPAEDCAVPADIHPSSKSEDD